MRRKLAFKYMQVHSLIVYDSQAYVTALNVSQNEFAQMCFKCFKVVDGP